MLCYSAPGPNADRRRNALRRLDFNGSDPGAELHPWNRRPELFQRHAQWARTRVRHRIGAEFYEPATSIVARQAARNGFLSVRGASRGGCRCAGQHCSGPVRSGSGISRCRARVVHLAVDAPRMHTPASRQGIFQRHDGHEWSCFRGVPRLCGSRGRRRSVDYRSQKLASAGPENLDAEAKENERE